MGPKPTRNATLRAWLEYLPQELYDTIHNKTFTIDPAPQALTKSHKPPAILQVSRTTHQALAPTYYGQKFHGAKAQIFHWLTSLSVEHKHLLQKGHLLCLVSLADVEASAAYQRFLARRCSCRVPVSAIEQFVGEMQRDWNCEWRELGQWTEMGARRGAGDVLRLFRSEGEIRGALEEGDATPPGN